MRFGLIGDHPTGQELTNALANLGRYELVVYAGPPPGALALQRAGHRFESVTDIEAFLAYRDLEFVLVADDLAYRAETLRRAAQSDKHVLCLHPPDLLPDITYETAMIQQETRKLLLPTLAWRLMPAVERIRELLASGALGTVEFLQWEPFLPAETAEAPHGWDGHPLLELWDLLRSLGGEVRDVSAVGPEEEELRPSDGLTLTGRFEKSGQFRVLLLPHGGIKEQYLLVKCQRGEAVLTLHSDGRAALRVPRADGDEATNWEPWNAGRAIASHVDEVLAGARPRVAWQDATRCLELFEAARQSVKRRRIIPMHYEEFTETANFKGVMAATGCGVLVLAVLIVIALLVFKLPLKPWFLGVVLPLLAIFLLLQALRWLVPNDEDSK